MKYGIAVAGTHGKTTTTSLLAHDPRRGRPRPDGGDRRQGARRSAPTRGSGRASCWSPRPTRATARFLLLSPTHRGRHQHRPRAPRPLRQRRAHARGVSRVHQPRAVLRRSPCSASTASRVRALLPQRAQALRHLRASRATPTAARATSCSRAAWRRASTCSQRGRWLGAVRLAHARPPQRAERARGDRGRRRELGVPFATMRARARRRSTASTAASRCAARSAASRSSTTTATIPRRSARRCAPRARASAAGSSPSSSRTATRARAICSTSFLGAFDDADLLVLTEIYAAGEDRIEGVSGEALCEALKRRGHADVRFVAARATTLLGAHRGRVLRRRRHRW